MPLLLRGDARALPLPDDSVDLVVTSPPYFGLRSYSDNGEHYDAQIGSEATPSEFLDALIACTAEMARVLKPSGSMWVNLGDSYYSGKGAPGRTTTDPKNPGRNARREGRSALDASGLGFPRKSLLLMPHRYAIRCMDELGLTVRQDQVWAKPNALPEPVIDRTRRCHEYFFHLVKSPRYFSAVDEIRTPHRRSWIPGRSGGHTYEAMKAPGEKDSNLAASSPNPLGALPGSVSEVATQPLKVPAHLGVDHFAAMPMAWPRWIIQGWCPPFGVVVDPFSGTGTTALVATMLGRRGVGVDMSADYNRLARWRCADPKERARAAGLDPDAVSKIHQEAPGQGDLFGEGDAA